MSKSRISHEALDEVERAMEEYRELIAELEADDVLAANTAKTYLLHSGNFVLWLKGEFEPGKRNKS